MSFPKKALLISAHFPPEGGGSVVRAYKMAKYLGYYGYQVHVLTKSPSSDAFIDESLLAELPPELPVMRSREPFIPDTRIPLRYFRWALSTVPLGKKIIQSRGIDVIWTTSNPPPTHLLGYWLKRITHIPWIADFRDPWTQNMHKNMSPWRMRIEERMERNALGTADVVTTVTPSFVENFQTKFGDVIRRIELIYNGFDLEDYKAVEAISDDNRFTAVYAGILYPTRSPDLLLEAVSELVNEGFIKRDKIQLQFIGRFDAPGETAHRDLVHRLGLEDIVDIMEPLPHKQVLAMLKSAHILLLVSDTLPSAGDYIPGKLYEYMAIGRPILALQMEGEAQRTIKTYGLGQVAHPLDKNAIKTAYLRMYQAWLEGRLPCEVNTTNVEMFDRRFQARQLAELMDDLLVSQD
jgi:glycosyltransferase involved in cell wall biosynthesis